RRDLLEAAAAQDRRFERELRRQAHADLFAGWRLPRLVVEDCKAAVTALLDPVGAGGEDEGPLIVERDLALAFDPGLDPADVVAPRQLPIRKPGGDALKARPPQRSRL